ncbi:MAG TPA: UvrD-helicase domain-containing protein, partial [Gaiellaceae bacterium]|nr:UvrD-helicase domain-containing protein [Gaiellaceae bacterium]
YRQSGARLAGVMHPDLPAEQAYLDAAYDSLDRMRETLLRAAEGGATEVAQQAIEDWATGRLRTFEDAERGLCFGRIDAETIADPIYVGRRWVHDDARRALVVNWQAPAARPFYTATPAAPHGVTLRRRFRTNGRELTGISDEALDGSLADASAVDDFLLEELERARDARMRDIVATIQADQYHLIARDPAPPLVIQGGPGTGKTAVGLHRASFLLYAHGDRLRRVLVVGPNPAFMEYVSHVLPTLGEERVDQRAVTELVPGVEITRTDSPALQRLKAEPRQAEELHRLAEAATEGEPQELVVRLEGRFVGVEADEVAELLVEARAEGLSTEARERFRMAVLRRFYEDYGVRLGGQAYRNFEEVEHALRGGGRLTRFLNTTWPIPKPEQLVRRLEVMRGSRRGWSEADLPLLDEARALLVGEPQRYGHVIVDEAQDLTPLQLRMVARRAGGAFTLLGDIAQATGPVPYARWDELLPHLPGGDGTQVAELRHAYRVPREIMELALPLLDTIAPEVEPPRAYRAGADAPRVVEAADPLAAAFEQAAALAGAEGLLAVIAPPSLRGDETASLFDDTRVAVLTPREAKGMEFDHVIVVEPAQIVAEAVEGQGLRELYVALTRPTTTLVVVHARPLPPELGCVKGPA